MRIVVLLSLFIFVVIAGYGQKIIIEGPSRACRGQAVELRLATSFDANTSQAFSVQVSVDGQQWQTIGSEFTAAGTIRAILPPSLPSDVTAYFRIVSANPVALSNELSIPMIDVPAIRLISAATGQDFFDIGSDSVEVNRLSVVRLRVANGRAESVQLTLNDSSTHTIYDKVSVISRTANRSFAYQIVQARNECGTVSIADQALKVKVRPVSLFIPYFGTPFVCAGSPFSLKVVASQPIANTSSWYAVLTPMAGTSSGPIRVPVSMTSDGVVTITSEPTTPLGSYHVSLRTDAPAMQVSIPQNDYVRIGRDNRLTIVDPRKTVAYGASVSLGVRYAPSYQRITYDDGFVSENAYNDYGRVVSPTQNTVYTIRSAESAYCGRAHLVGPVSYTVTVAPGIIIDSLSSYEMCAGTTVTGYYRTNTSLAPGTTFVVQLNRVITVAATVIDANRFRLLIPATLNAGTYTLAAVWNGMVGRVATRSLLVKGVPSIDLRTNDLLYQNYPGVYTLLLISSTYSRQLTIDWHDGEQVRSLHGTGQQLLVHAYAAKATNTFRLLSVRNECGERSADNSLTIRVQQPQQPSLGLQLPRVYNNSVIADYCPGDSVAVVVRATNLPDSPVYQIEYSTQESTWTGQYLTGRFKAGAVSVRLPMQGGLYWLRVKSTETGQVSVPVRVFAASKTTARLSAVSDNYVDGLVTMAVSFADSRPPFRYQLSNGYTGVAEDGGQLLQFPVAMGTRYQLTSVSSGCNVPASIAADTVRVSQKTEVKPQILSAGEFVTEMHGTIPCEGGIMRIPFLLKGTFPSGTRLEAHLYENNQFVQKLTVLDPVSPATIRLDSVRAAFKNGGYSIRLFMVKDGSVLAYNAVDNNYTIRIRRPGTIRLTGGENGQLLLKSSGLQVTGNLILTGAGMATVWLNSGEIVTVPDRTASYPVSFAKTGTYTIKQALNECGLIPASGQVVVKQEPSIESYKVVGQLCRNRPTQITYKTVGDFPPDNEFTFIFRPFPGDKLYILARTRQTQGPVMVTWPADLKAGVFGTLTINASNPVISREIDRFTIQETPVVRLVPSTTTVYPGQAVFLPVVFDAGSVRSDLRFENGPVSLNNFTKEVAVYPVQTTTYRLASVSNECGIGTVTGSATVQVIPQTNPSVGIGYVGDYYTLCAGKESTVSFRPVGTFGADNVFSLQLSDSTGQNYRTIVTNSQGSQSDFRFTLPADTPPGRAYRLRVSASSPALVGSSSSYPMTVSPPVTGEIISTRQQVNKGDSAVVTLKFTGVPPFRYALTSGYYSVVDGIGVDDYTRTLRPRIDTSQQFCLLQVSTPTCGTGSVVPEKATMIVDVVGQPYDVEALEAIVFPNPATDKIVISVLACEADQLTLTLTTMAGELLFRQDKHIHNSTTETLPMTSYASGMYLLKATAGNRQRTFRILKK